MREIVLAVLMSVTAPVIYAAQTITAGSLPTPVVTQNSVETCLNSRYSQHSLGKAAATVQQISNILWAAGRAPVTGSYRNVYVAMPGGTYLYHPASHTLSWYSKDVPSDGGFNLIYDAERTFDAGVMFMPAMLASVSLGRSTESAVASCPKAGGYPKTRLIFGVQANNALTTQVMAHSSVAQGQSGWLPDPCTTGGVSLEDVLANLKYVDRFGDANLPLQRMSQILWAGYGCTAHTTSNGRAGLTVPSAQANYYLSRGIYLVYEDGARRYQSRATSGSLTSRDHRLEAVSTTTGTTRPGSGTIPTPEPGALRGGLRSAVVGLPKAPCYVVLCVESASAGSEWAQLEVGFAAGNMLIQASAIGLGCHFKSDLTTAEQQSVRAVTGIPATQVPLAIVSLGGLAPSISLTGDANCDGFVDLDDYVILSRSWLSSKSQAAYDARADFDRNEHIDVPDLALLAAHWLTVP